MHHSFSREELFGMVWAEPCVKIAKRLGISDVGLAKICRANDITLPPRGYWARIDAGQSPKKTAAHYPISGQR